MGDFLTDSPLSAKKLTLRYIVGMGLIVGLAVLTYGLMMSIISTEAKRAAQVNVSGRQRMYSQRILSNALQITTAPDEASRLRARARLKRAVAGFQAQHIALTRGGAIVPKVTDPQVLDVFNGDKWNLNNKVETYIKTAKAVLVLAGQRKLSTGDPQIKKLLAMGNTDLLAGLDEVVARLQSQAEQKIRMLEATAGVVLLAMLLLVGLEVVLIFKPMVAEVGMKQRRLEQLNTELERLATTDRLTGALNRRGFYYVLGREMALTTRHPQHLSLIFIDVDHFKPVNDALGHQAGDEVLKEFVELVQKHIRQTDYFCRWGGEEFALVATQTGIDAAVSIAEKLRTVVEQHVFCGELRLTTSFGVTEMQAGEGADDLIRKADGNLYRAKKAGRNQVVASKALAV